MTEAEAMASFIRETRAEREDADVDVEVSFISPHFTSLHLTSPHFTSFWRKNLSIGMTKADGR